LRFRYELFNSLQDIHVLQESADNAGPEVGSPGKDALLEEACKKYEAATQLCPTLHEVLLTFSYATLIISLVAILPFWSCMTYVLLAPICEEAGLVFGSHY
jgi:hypothetical protein